MLRSPVNTSLASTVRPILGFSRSLRGDNGALRRSMCGAFLSKATARLRHPIKAMATLSKEDRPPLGPWELLNPSTYKAEEGSMKGKARAPSGCC